MKLVPTNLKGELNIPASKSDGQRATLAAGLAKGKSYIHNLGKSDDELQMLENVKRFGAKVSVDQKVEIEGTISFPNKGNWNLGESGLGFRLMAAQCAVHPGEFTMTGHKTLMGRPMPFFKKFLNTSSLKVKDNEGKLPISFEGHLNSAKLIVDGSQSSQYISGLLMALPLGSQNVELVVENLASSPYVEMTLDTLKQFGICIDYKDLNSYRIEGNQEYQATHYAVESDWSSASCWLAAAALGHDIRLHGLRMDSLQADRAMIKALEDANCQVKLDTKGIKVTGENRLPLNFDANDCPDLFPALALYAAFTKGVSKIKGINRLKDKESDRAQTLFKEYSKLGVKMELDYLKDTMLVEGGVTLKDANLDSHGDHRIAMSLGLAATFLEKTCTLLNPECVSKSYPQFWEHMSSLQVKA